MTTTATKNNFVIVGIKDLRDEFEGHRVPLKAGEDPHECTRCGRKHAVIYMVDELEENKTVRYHSVGGGCAKVLLGYTPPKRESFEVLLLIATQEIIVPALEIINSRSPLIRYNGIHRTSTGAAYQEFVGDGYTLAHLPCKDFPSWEVNFRTTPLHKISSFYLECAIRRWKALILENSIKEYCEKNQARFETSEIVRKAHEICHVWA